MSGRLFSFLAGAIGGPLGAVGYRVGRDMFDSPLLGFIAGFAANSLLKYALDPSDSEEEAKAKKDAAEKSKEDTSKVAVWAVKRNPEATNAVLRHGEEYNIRDAEGDVDFEASYRDIIFSPTAHQKLKDLVAEG